MDRHSFLVPPDLMPLYMQERKAEYVGVGVRVARLEAGGLEVTSVMREGPAERGGVRAGDRIVSIDGQAIQEIRFIDALRALSSPGLAAGTTVLLGILRPGNDSVLSLTITLGLIRPELLTARMLAPGLAYVRMAEFKRGVDAELRNKLAELGTNEGPITGLVIDLRGNPGGEMASCVDALRLFIAEGVLVEMESSLPGDPTSLRANGTRLYTWPLVVLTDESSASAAELFAGALQYYGTATVVGRRSYGKGTFQTLVPLAGDMAFHLTVGRFFLPGGVAVDGVGITPDRIVGAQASEEEWLRAARFALRPR